MPTKLEKPLPPDEGWQDVNAPDLIKWDKAGEQVMGVLTSVSKITITVDGKSKQAVQYLLTLGEKQFKFLGTFDIAQKLTSRHVGCQVRIKYLGEDENIRGGPNNTPMKVFSVQIKGTPTAANVHGVPITDEDIPF
jgi:hypothetical protein